MPYIMTSPIKGDLSATLSFTVFSSPCIKPDSCSIMTLLAFRPLQTSLCRSPTYGKLTQPSSTDIPATKNGAIGPAAHIVSYQFPNPEVVSASMQSKGDLPTGALNFLGSRPIFRGLLDCAGGCLFAGRRCNGSCALGAEVVVEDERSNAAFRGDGVPRHILHRRRSFELNNVTNSHTITFEESYLTPEDLRREEAEVHC